MHLVTTLSFSYVSLKVGSSPQFKVDSMKIGDSSLYKSVGDFNARLVSSHYVRLSIMVYILKVFSLHN